MIAKGLLVRFDARDDQTGAVEDFLYSTLPLVRREPATQAWFALRFGATEYGIVGDFADDTGRDAHLAGAAASALLAQAETWFVRPPTLQRFDVLADKWPFAAPAVPDTKALLLTFKAKAGHETDVVQFLHDAQPLVQAEPGTTAWFALPLDDGHYGIFDVFPDNSARLHHLTWHVPRELAKHALSLLGSLPDPACSPKSSANEVDRTIERRSSA